MAATSERSSPDLNGRGGRHADLGQPARPAHDQGARGLRPCAAAAASERRAVAIRRREAMSPDERRATRRRLVTEDDRGLDVDVEPKRTRSTPAASKIYPKPVHGRSAGSSGRC